MKSYGYNEQGDTAIGHFLDTMRKYNPDKLLQADLLTPISKRYLNRVNENQLWNESMRTKIVETLAERQDFYRKNRMPWMIGNFQIRLADKNRKATTKEELEWFLSKAAAFDAGFGLDFSAETMRAHGLTDEMLSTIKDWETFRLSHAFTEAQKEAFKDPYGNWHIEKVDDTIYFLYPQHISRRYFCNYEEDTWQWNNPYASPMALCIAVEGKGSINDLYLETPNDSLRFPVTLKAGQHLCYNFDGTAYITDSNYNKIKEIETQGVIFLNEGNSQVSFTCNVKTEEKKTPHVALRFITQGSPTQLNN